MVFYENLLTGEPKHKEWKIQELFDVLFFRSGCKDKKHFITTKFKISFSKNNFENDVNRPTDRPLPGEKGLAEEQKNQS